MTDEDDPPKPGQLGFDWTPKPAPVQKRSAKPHPPSPQTAIIAADEPEPPQKAVESDQHAAAAPATGGSAYGPGHPWHYYPQGDAAEPIPFGDIPASESAGRSLAEELPKAPAKRIARVRELLESERQQLAERAARYQTIIEKGADALSRYDREIAYGGNLELARAGTLAILYNQIAWSRGRLARLERENARGGRRGR